MGDDEYHPLSHTGSNLTKAGGIGYTIVDSIDTMLIMGLRDEYQRAKEWVQSDLSFDRDGDVSTFEVCTMPSSDRIYRHERGVSIVDHHTRIGWATGCVPPFRARSHFPRESPRPRKPYPSRVRDSLGSPAFLC